MSSAGGAQPGAPRKVVQRDILIHRVGAVDRARADAHVREAALLHQYQPRHDHDDA
jgi:hypothetical protein